MNGLTKTWKKNPENMSKNNSCHLVLLERPKEHKVLSQKTKGNNPNSHMSKRTEEGLVMRSIHCKH
jgi:hypothetical protein